MIANYIKVLFRHLWRNRLFTTLNIVGLSVSICVAWMIFRIVSYEYSFDKSIKGSENIFMLVSKSKEGNGNSVSDFYAVSRPVYSVMKNEISGVDLVAPVFIDYVGVVRVADDSVTASKKNTKSASLCSTVSDYFKLFNYHWIAGNPATALEAPDQVVLTDKQAEKYFPSLKPEEAIGKVIIYEDSIYRHVSGIVAALPEPSSFNIECNEFIKVNPKELTYDRWIGTSSNDLLFFKPAKDNSPKLILDQLNRFTKNLKRDEFEKYKYESWFGVVSLNKVHLETTFGPHNSTTNVSVLRALILVGIFLLLLACINYINLTTAMLPSRAKGIGIRKTLGSSSGRIVLRFMGETFLLTLAATFFSFVLTVFASQLFIDFLPKGMPEYLDYPLMALFLLALIALITTLAGVYPAILATRTNTVSILKGATDNIVGRKGVSSRKALIIFQFCIAQVFIIGAIIIHQQLQFALNRNPGFDKNGIVTFYTPGAYLDSAYKGKTIVLKNELLNSALISGVAIGNRPMERSWSSGTFVYQNDKTEISKTVKMKRIDSNYLGVYKIPLLAGLNIAPADSINELLINEKAAQVFGFKSPEAAIGKYLKFPGEKTRSFPVAGVVADFNQFGVQSEIDPLIMTNPEFEMGTFNVRLAGNPHDWNRGLQFIEQNFKKLYPGAPFNYNFYDDTIKTFYGEEEKLQTMVSAASAITILISCLGLFGLVTLTTFRRTKEIGIRKILGASVAGITNLLTKEFLWLVFISVVIASPIAWWMMNKWLQDYAYKIEIRWWMFLLAAFAACMTALLTVSYQAIKAARTNPVESLRTE